MSYTVVTSFHQAGMESYGQRMIDTWEQFWPSTVDLRVYAENCHPQVRRPNSEVIDLLSVSSDCVNFVERHRNNPEAHGGQGPHNAEIWSERKNFKWQAVRFCYKVFALQHAGRTVTTDWLIWIDADTTTHTAVPVEWLNRVCPMGFMGSYLGRSDNYHSECGWIAYNLKHPACRDFIERVAEMYVRDEIFNHKEWHDSYIWDVVRKTWRDQRGVELMNLNPEPDTKGLAKHPFINSELGRYMDHFKGERKKNGHSKGKEIVSHRDHPYWQRILQAGK